MSRKDSVLITAGVLLLMMAGHSANAQISLSFFEPELVDPNQVLTYVNPNAQSVNGSALIPASFPTTKGIEIHSAIPSGGGIRDITELTLHFTYLSDDLSVQSLATSGYMPWTITSVTSVSGFYTVVLTETSPPPVMAPINNNYVPGGGNPFNQSFATLSVSGNASELTTFASQNANNGVSITPTGLGQTRFAVPEPGAIALLSGLVVTAGLFSMTRLRRRS